MGIWSMTKSIVVSDWLYHLLTVPSESKALTTGPQGKDFQDKAWKEVVCLLESQAAEVRGIVESLGISHV